MNLPKTMFKFLKPASKKVTLFNVVLIISLILFGTSAVLINNKYWHRNFNVKEFTFKLDVKPKKQEIIAQKEEVKPVATAPVTTSTWPVVLSKAEAATITVVVNKKHKLPADYVPAGLKSTVDGWPLRAEAADAYDNLKAEAAKAGYSLKIISSYRSYYDQQAIYNNYVAVDGQAKADTYSARPGHSEHQLGLTADLGIIGGGCALSSCFGDTAEGKWVATNAPAFGFIIRYPAGKEAITGYQYEPWHIRYVGVSTAMAVTASGKTLDEYFGIPAGGYQ